MSITAAQVKELRELTGAGMMECKKALVEVKGDMEAAIEFLRKTGKAKAAKKADRIAKEGIIVLEVTPDSKYGVVVEVNCETDFVARDQSFRHFAASIAKQALAKEVKDVKDLSSLPWQEDLSKTIDQARENLIATLGENILIRRLALVTTPGVLGCYKHGDRIGVVVAIDIANGELAHDLALHIAASDPKAISALDIPTDIINKEREIYLSRAQASGKPQAVIEKMVEGQINSFLKEYTLLDQPFLKSPEQTVAALVKKAGAKVLEFVRFELGAGIDKPNIDFAEEVMAQLGKD